MCNRAKNDRSGTMSIETLLTLGLAGVILLAAALMRLVVLGLLELGLRIAGRDTAWLHPFRRARTDEAIRPARPPLRPRVVHAYRSAQGAVVPRVRTGTAAALAAMVLVVMTLAGWALFVGREAVQGGRGAFAWLRPRMISASSQVGRSARAVLSWLRPRLVMGIATMQHLLRAARESFVARAEARTERRRERVGADAAESGPAPPEPGVIDLDKDWDPLKDPLPPELSDPLSPEERVKTSL